MRVQRGGMRPPVTAIPLACAVILLAALAPSAIAAQGQWERAWGKDVVFGGGSTGFENCTVAADCQPGATGTDLGEMNAPEGVATDAAGNVYVADTGNNRIQKFNSQGGPLSVLGTAGGLGGQMSSPAGVATDSAGNVYVADTGNNRVQKFDSQGNFLRAWGKNVDSGGGTGFEICTVAINCKAGDVGSAGGEMSAPSGIATAGGKVYVADYGNNRIQEFDSQGNWQRAWGKDVVSGDGTGFEVCSAVATDCRAGATGGLGGEMNGPDAVATDSAGNVYVADSNNKRIQKFDSQVNWKRAWGKDVVSGGGTGFEICTVAANCQAGADGAHGGEMYLGVQGVATDGAGNVYTGEFNAARVQKFDSKGHFLRAFPQFGGGICTVAANCNGGAAGGLGDQFEGTYGVATDSAGNLYVADYGNNRMQKFTDPPNTKLTKAKISSRKRKAAFSFKGSGGTPPLSFQCKLTGQGRKLKKFRSCASPTRYKHLRPGRHVFFVRAKDIRGLPDRTPAKKRFRIR